MHVGQNGLFVSLSVSSQVPKKIVMNQRNVDVIKIDYKKLKNILLFTSVIKTSKTKRYDNLLF